MLAEAHSLRYFIHSCESMMYHDLRQLYWWPRINRDIVEYIPKWHTYHKVNDGHQRAMNLLPRIPILERKWERIAIDFVVVLSKSLGKHDSIWVITDRLTKLAYFIFVRVDFNSK